MYIYYLDLIPENSEKAKENVNSKESVSSEQTVKNGKSVSTDAKTSSSNKKRCVISFNTLTHTQYI